MTGTDTAAGATHRKEQRFDSCSSHSNPCPQQPQQCSEAPPSLNITTISLSSSSTPEAHSLPGCCPCAAPSWVCCARGAAAHGAVAPAHHPSARVSWRQTGNLLAAASGAVLPEVMCCQAPEVSPGGHQDRTRDPWPTLLLALAAARSCQPGKAPRTSCAQRPGRELHM